MGVWGCGVGMWCGGLFGKEVMGKLVGAAADREGLACGWGVGRVWHESDRHLFASLRQCP